MAADAPLAVHFNDCRVAIAVSGGADSMALLLLARAWAAAHGGEMVALTVDHGLREAAAAEARQVAVWCHQLGVSHHILNAAAMGIAIKRRQADAREARYQLLSAWCAANGYPALATGHHRGDQAETLFFRLGRGSGLLGLASIAPLSQRHGISLVRPLLNIPKSQLINYLHAQSQPWLEDESNHSPRYVRNVLRRALQQQPDYERIEARAAALAEFFGRMRGHVEHQLSASLAETTRMDGGHAILSLSGFKHLPCELGLLMLARLITQLTGDTHPPRSAKLARLARCLKDEDFTAYELAGLGFKRIGVDAIKISGKT